MRIVKRIVLLTFAIVIPLAIYGRGFDIGSHHRLTTVQTVFSLVNFGIAVYLCYTGLMTKIGIENDWTK